MKSFEMVGVYVADLTQNVPPMGKLMSFGWDSNQNPYYVPGPGGVGVPID